MRKDKRGISEVMGYVILIIIAISLSIMVYSWLKGFIFQPEKKCSDELNIAIKEYNCNSGIINLTLYNNGFFGIDGFLARVSNSSGKAIYFLMRNPNEIENFFLNPDKKLMPDKEYSIQFDYTKYGLIRKIEIQPFIIDKDIVICSDKIVRQDIENCGSQVIPAGSCTDSDGGQNYDVKGTTNTNTDFCSATTLYEYYCSGDSVVSTTYSCPDGKTCDDGKCIDSLCAPKVCCSVNSDCPDNNPCVTSVISDIGGSSGTCSWYHGTNGEYCDKADGNADCSPEFQCNPNCAFPNLSWCSQMLPAGSNSQTASDCASCEILNGICQ